MAQLDAARVGLHLPALPADLSVAAYVRDPRTLLTRAEIEARVGTLRQADEPATLVAHHTFAGLSGNLATFCAVPLYVQGCRYGVAMVGWVPEIHER